MADQSYNAGVQPTFVTQGGYGAPGSNPQGGQGYPSQPQPQYGAAPTGDGRPPKRDLFDMISGIPANLAIILGLFFVLLGGMLPDCRSAGARSAVAEWEQARAVIELELDSFRETQEDQRRAEEAARVANPLTPLDPTADARRAEALRTRERQLQSQHHLDDLQRDAIDAQATVAGMNAHYVVEWIGYVLLLIGLFAVTMASTGLKQKVCLVVLVVVLFSALNGLRLNLNANAAVGEESPSSSSRSLSPSRSSRDRL